jgi:hypothetical protein
LAVLASYTLALSWQDAPVVEYRVSALTQARFLHVMLCAKKQADKQKNYIDPFQFALSKAATT